MGLDMYLYRTHYVGNKWREDNQKVTVAVPDGDMLKINSDRIKEITEEVMYWRKANAIHKWFVDNVQQGNDDCKTYYVSVEQLTQLRDLCREVLASTKLIDGNVVNGYTLTAFGKVASIQPGKIVEDASKAHALLPTQSGFFFGGTDYDQWYWESIADTEVELTKLLEEDQNADYEYRSSW